MCSIIIPFFLVFMGLGPGLLLYVNFKCTIQKNSSEAIKELNWWAMSNIIHFGSIQTRLCTLHTADCSIWLFQWNLTAIVSLCQRCCCCSYCTTIQIFILFFKFQTNKRWPIQSWHRFRKSNQTTTIAFKFDVGLQVVCLRWEWRWCRCRFCDNKLLGIFIVEWTTR